MSGKRQPFTTSEVTCCRFRHILRVTQTNTGKIQHERRLHDIRGWVLGETHRRGATTDNILSTLKVQVYERKKFDFDVIILVNYLIFFNLSNLIYLLSYVLVTGHVEMKI